MKAPKTRNIGSDRLIKRSEWVPRSEIQSSDREVLTHPLFDKAFNRIVELHKPKHKIALCSLCTVTRPYSVGRKWKTLIKYFSKHCDLIINSNGGVIPIEFERCYPFLTYDAHGEKENDELYISTLRQRLIKFFEVHRYDYIMFLFRHNLRNSIYSEEVGQNLRQRNLIRNYAVMPSERLYLASQREGFANQGYSMFPELYPKMLQPVLTKVKEWSQ